MPDERFEDIRRAYLRGIEWAKKNGFDERFYQKAAYDYADKATSPKESAK